MILYVIYAKGFQILGKTTQSVEAQPVAIQQSVEQVRKNLDLLREKMNPCSNVLYHIELHSAGHKLKEKHITATSIEEIYNCDSLQSMAKAAEDFCKTISDQKI